MRSRWLLLIVAAIVLLICSQSPQPVAKASVSCPEPESCAEIEQFCNETAAELCGWYAPCCVGNCLSNHPQNVCNGDVWQCRCYDINRR